MAWRRRRREEVAPRHHPERLAARSRSNPRRGQDGRAPIHRAVAAPRPLVQAPERRLARRVGHRDRDLEAASLGGRIMGFIYGVAAVALILVFAGLWLVLNSARRKSPLVKIALVLVGVALAGVGLLLLFGGSKPVLP